MGLAQIFSIIKSGLAEIKKYSIIYITVAIPYLLIGLVMPYISGIYVDRLLAGVDIHVIWMFVIAFGVVYLLQSVINFGWDLINSLFSNTFFFHMMVGPAKHITRSLYSRFSTMDTAKTISQVNQDGLAFLNFLQGLISTITGVVTLAASVGMLFFVNWRIALLVFAVAPIYFALYLGFRNKLFLLNKEKNESADIYFSRKNELLTRLVFIKRNQLNNVFESRVDAAFEGMMSKQVRLTISSYFFDNAGTLTSAAFHLLVIGVGGYHVLHGNLTIGHFTIITLYFNMIVRQIAVFFKFAATYQNTRVAAERTSKIYQNPIDTDGHQIFDSIETVELQNLSLTYGDKRVFSNVNKTFEKGKIYAICGENGSGKSSLLNCLMGLYPDICTGKIIFDGVPQHELDMAHIRYNRIAFVEQSPEFINVSIKDYLKLGIETTHTTAKNRADLVQAFNLSKFDFSDTITESGSNYSGGEKQKFAITRALSKDCAIAILDEPTSALDTDSVDILADILAKQKAGRITLVISHDSRILDLCDEKWYISK